MRRRGGQRGSRIVLRVCAAVVAAASIAGCGVAADGPIPHSGGAQSSFARSGPKLTGPIDTDAVSGDVILFTGSNPIEAKIMRGLIRRFEHDHPKINVRFTAINRDYPTVVLTRFAGGEAPDVFTVDGKFLNDWSGKGLLMPLDRFLSVEHVDISRYRPQLIQSVKGPGGQLYALPVNYSTVALFVNDDMLAKAGVTQAPRDWTELEAVARRLTTKPGAANGHVGLCLVPTWERMLLFALQQDGGITSPDGTHMIVKEKSTRRALDWVRHMLASGAAATPDKMGSSWCGDAFGRGETAMALEGAWMLPPMRSQFPDTHYSIHQLPVGSRAATLAYSGNLSISRTSKNPEAAWMLLDYLASPHAQAELAKIGVGVPAMTGVDFPPELDEFANGIDHATVWALPSGFFNTVLVTADNEMSAVLEGKQTVEGMLDEIQSIGNTMLEAGAE